MRVLRVVAVASAILAGAGGFAPFGARAATAASIAGVAFQDVNRNGVQDPGEAAYEGHQLYLLDASDGFVAATTTGADGRYRFDIAAAGTYTVQYSFSSWDSLRRDHVPTTTGGLEPRITRSVSDATTVDFGWRAIVRSTTFGSPISSVVGAEGLRVESYNDAVTATQIHDAVLRGLVGAEASSVSVHFDWGTGSTCTTAAGQTDGRYTSFAADVYVTWDSWLTAGDTELSHEYGHAWSLYHAHLDDQDPTMRGYLQARGLADDPRVNSSYAWSTREMIAEDYRQLFGSENARSAAQTNTDIPPAAQVTGLREYLAGPFLTPTSPSSTPTAALTISGLAMNPAPVTKSGTATFAVSAPARVTVTITDRAGTLVQTLLSGVDTSGSVKATWNRTNSKGKRVPAGVYRVNVKAVSGSGATATDARDFNVS